MDLESLNIIMEIFIKDNGKIIFLMVCVKNINLIKKFIKVKFLKEIFMEKEKLFIKKKNEFIKVIFLII